MERSLARAALARQGGATAEADADLCGTHVAPIKPPPATTRTPPSQPHIVPLPRFMRGSLTIPGAGSMAIDAGPINGTVATANSLGAMLPQGALLDAQEYNTLEGEIAKMKALGADSGKHVDAFKKESSRFESLLKATNGPVAEAAREFSTSVGQMRAAAKKVPEALTRVDKERARLDAVINRASAASEEEKAKINQAVVDQMNNDVKAAVDFVVGITTALAGGGAAGAVKFAGEQAAGAAKGAAVDMGKALLTSVIKEFLPNLKSTEQAVAAAKANAARMVKDAEAADLKAATLALKEAGQGAEAIKTELEEKAIDVSIKQRTLETALTNAGLPGMASAMGARAKAQVQHTRTIEALAKYEANMQTTAAAGSEASGAYWAVVKAGCAPAPAMEFPISNKNAVLGPARANADEAMTQSVWAESQKKFGDQTRAELGEYLASYDQVVTLLRSAMGAE